MLATLPVALSCFSPLAGAQTALSAEECLALYDGTDCVGKRFTIGNRTELEAMQGNNCYKLIDNIDLAGENWSPQPGNFTGTVCSNGHAIQNMNITHSNGANSGFHARSGDGVRMELVFESPRVMVSGSTSTAGFPFAQVAGSNGRMAITVRQAEMEMTGSNLHSAGGLAGTVFDSSANINNHLSLMGEGIQINDNTTRMSSGYASLGWALTSSNNVTLHQLHDATLSSSQEYIGAGVALIFLGNHIQLTLSECSAITLISRYSRSTTAYLSFGIAINNQDDNHIDLRAVEGISWYDGNDMVTVKEALLMGDASSRPATVSGTLLVANSGPDGYALIDVTGGEVKVNCSSVYWDISRNGRTESGCRNNTGHGVYTHTAEGWNEIWLHHGIDNGDRVPGERQLTPAGAAPVLLTYQYFRGHPYVPEYRDGHFYKNESGGIEFKKQGTGPLILRPLSLVNNTGNLTLHFGEPRAYDHPDNRLANDTTTPYKNTWASRTSNNISLVLYSWYDNLMHWLNIDNDGQASEPRNLTVAGNPLALDSHNLFTYNSTTGYIHHYQLDHKTMSSYLPDPGFNPDAEDIAFAVGQNNTLFQAVRNGTQVDITPVSFNDTQYTPVSIDYQQPGEFQLFLNPDDDTSGTARVIPRQATLVDGYQLTLKDPKHDWNLYSYEGEGAVQPQPAASASYSFNIVTPVPVTPTASFSEIASAPTAVASGTGSSTSMAPTRTGTPSPTATPSEATSGSGYQTVAGGVTMVGLAVLAGLLNGAR